MCDYKKCRDFVKCFRVNLFLESSYHYNSLKIDLGMLAGRQEEYGFFNLDFWSFRIQGNKEPITLARKSVQKSLTNPETFCVIDKKRRSFR